MQQKKFREAEGLFVVEGIKLFHELVASSAYQIDEILIVEDAPLIDELQPEQALLLKIISKKDLERISGLKQPNQVLTVVKKKAIAQPDYSADGLVLFLDDVKDPGNLGTIIRTADWFGVKQIVCSRTTVELYNPKVVQASMGSIFRMQMTYSELLPALDEAKSAGFDLVCADMDGENLYDFQFNAKTGLVMGSESHGVSEDIRSITKAITIPKKGQAESLNVAMACGIISSEFNRST